MVKSKKKALLVAYDISSNQRRKKIADYLEAIGERINKSVFICTYGNLSITQIEDDLKTYIKKQDTLYITPLCKACFEKGKIIEKKNKKKSDNYTEFL